MTRKDPVVRIRYNLQLIRSIYFAAIYQNPGNWQIPSLLQRRMISLDSLRVSMPVRPSVRLDTAADTPGKMHAEKWKPRVRNWIYQTSEMLVLRLRHFHSTLHLTHVRKVYMAHSSVN